jgi:cytoskeletal protein CcmA (bactofilin family)
VAKESKRRAFDVIKDFATTIGAGSTLEGELQGKDNCLVLGRVTGHGRLEGSLIVGVGARWQGSIEAENVMVAGEVEGDITARNQLEVVAGARIHGRLSCPNIAIADGAIHSGEVDMARQEGRVTYYTERRKG